MKISLATTTIHDATPTWRWLEACDKDAHILIAGDLKTPMFELPAPAEYYSPDHQRALGYKCSELLGFNSIERRNIAVLEALKQGADVVVYHDTDNLPLALDYYLSFQVALDRPFYGLAARASTGWFDPGRLLQPATTQRGFPYQIESQWEIEPVTDVKVGVVSGMILGDPDVSAVERIANKPLVHGMSDLLRNGIVVTGDTWTIFNTQNTAVLRQFAPCMLTCPQFGRYADIFASLVCQRVMREHGYAVHLGLPAVWQQRNKHDLVKDLQDEMFGMAHVVEFAEVLDGVDITGADVLDAVGLIYWSIRRWPHCPEGVPELAEAWLQDCESVL